LLCRAAELEAVSGPNLRRHAIRLMTSAKIKPSKGSSESRAVLPDASLLTSLRGSKLTEVLRDLAEIGIDAALNGGLLKEIPVLKSIVGVRSTAIAVRDYFLLKKVITFLVELDQIPLDDREEFVSRIESDSDFAKQVAETVIQYLDRYDHVDKASILAKVFIAYGRQEIDLDEFFTLASSLDRAFIRDLELLLDYYEAEDPGTLDIRTSKRNLFSSDLSDFYVLTHQEMRDGGFEHPQVYHLNKRAETLAKIVLGRRFHGERW